MFCKEAEMERVLIWVLVLAVCASVGTITDLNDSWLVAAESNERADRKLANFDTSGVISIDCGVNEDYTDKTTNIQYQADKKFVQFGHIYHVSSSYTNTYGYTKPYTNQLNTLRSFPEGMRNCYTLKPKEGVNKTYLIRAQFAYGNYDNKNEVPVFEVHLGVNYWITIRFKGAGYVVQGEVIHITMTGTIDVCLININQGVPFISLLELWPLNTSVYQSNSTALQPLGLMTRPSMFKNDAFFIRYEDDIYGRSWHTVTGTDEEIDRSSTKKTAADIDLDALVDPYKLPREVLSNTVEALNQSFSLDIIHNYLKSEEYLVHLHFFDFEDRASNMTRKMDITFNGDDAFTVSLSLPRWKPYSIVQHLRGTAANNISIKSTPDSDLPALLNAYEIYWILPQPFSATQQQDVNAIREIKDKYMISRVNWQGDPCGPISFTWEALSCSHGNNSRIMSLNLSSSKLTGGIVDSFSNLTSLEILDLSYNELTGKLPNFLADLPKLKILNLAGNMLTGPVPEALIAKKSNNSLQLSLDGNPSLCQMGLCEIKSNSHKKSNLTLVASVTASVSVLLLIVATVTVVIRRQKRKNEGVMSQRYKKDDEQLNSKNISYFEILSITNDFETMIGEGGFGNVYLGALQDGRRVAVKLLSLSSKQGYKEFQSEARLLMVIHHRNLVSLVGYCDEGDIKALIYEYMLNGNLQQQLSGKNLNVLKWNERLQIALDIAHGLDYLHNGCKPPIIHRDLKTSNILLDENMEAKISDFGLSTAFANDIDSHVSTRPAGTPGYLDPKFHSSWKLNKKSDVYSFGIILLELITGQPAIIRTDPDNLTHIPDWVNLKLETGDIQAIVDPRLQGECDTNSVWKYVEIAMSCIAQAAIQRPDISDVVSELKECLPLEIFIERGYPHNPLDMGSLQTGSLTDVSPR